MFDMILSAFKQSHNLDGRIPYCQLEQGGGGHQDESPLGASYTLGSTSFVSPPKKVSFAKGKELFCQNSERFYQIFSI